MKFAPILLALTFSLWGCQEDSADEEQSGEDVALVSEDGGQGGEDASVDPDEDAAVEPGEDASVGPEADAEVVVDAELLPDIPVTPPDMAVEADPFSFFVTSLEAIREHSGSEDGFGGDLGGLAGADELCQTIAGTVGQGAKEWRAFLSVTEGPEGGPVHAIERIGEGPWYDANGRLVAENIAGLLAEARPQGDAQSVADLPNEFGVPLSSYGDAHDVITGSDQDGRLASNDPVQTCNDWTSAESNAAARPMCGHSFPRMGRGGRPPRGDDGAHWISDHPLRGCTPGVNLIQNGPGEGDCIGCSGGYGAVYCFALTP